MSLSEPNRGCTRRSLIKSAVTVAGASALSGCVTQAQRPETAPGDSLAKDDVVVFQGDSITDAGRDKKSDAPNDFNALGRGYANMLASALLGAYPSKRLQCYNRGISGNKVPDLQAFFFKPSGREFESMCGVC